uniref:Uncharacterized protein n=1 Tax=Oryza meridionalis TaxID=40149 RepID=A0A0E0C0V1_9ORYZ
MAFHAELLLAATDPRRRKGSVGKSPPPPPIPAAGIPSVTKSPPLPSAPICSPPPPDPHCRHRALTLLSPYTPHLIAQNKGNLQLWSIRGKKVIKKKAVDDDKPESF